MKITVVRPAELSENEILRWRELQKASPSLDNPFLSVEFTLAMGRLRSYVHVAVIEDSDHIAGCLVITVAVTAMAELARAARLALLPLGLWIAASPFLLRAGRGVDDLREVTPFRD